MPKLPAKLDAAGSSLCQAGLDPFPDQVALEVGKAGQDCAHQLAARGAEIEAEARLSQDGNFPTVQIVEGLARSCVLRPHRLSSVTVTRMASISWALASARTLARSGRALSAPDAANPIEPLPRRAPGHHTKGTRGDLTYSDLINGAYFASAGIRPAKDLAKAGVKDDTGAHAQDHGQSFRRRAFRG